MNLMVAAVVRAIMYVIGTATGVTGWNDEDTIITVTGGIVAIIPLLWALVEKFRLGQRGVKKVRLRPKKYKAPQSPDPAHAKVQRDLENQARR